MLLGINTDLRSAITTDGFELPGNYADYEWYIVPEEYRGLNFGVSFVDTEEGVEPVLMLDGEPVDAATVDELKQECFLDIANVIEFSANKTQLSTNEQLDVTLLKGGQLITSDVEIQLFDGNTLIGTKIGTTMSARFSRSGRYKIVVKDQPCLPITVYVQDPSVQIF